METSSERHRREAVAVVASPVVHVPVIIVEAPVQPIQPLQPVLPEIAHLVPMQAPPVQVIEIVENSDEVDQTVVQVVQLDPGTAWVHDMFAEAFEVGTEGSVGHIGEKRTVPYRTYDEL